MSFDTSHRHGLRHSYLSYSGSSEYLDGIRRFVDEGLSTGEPVMLAVTPSHSELLRSTIDGTSVHTIDMSELGRNPRRVIPAVWEFVADRGGGPARVLCEFQWPARSAADSAEVTRQEALLNLALARLPVTMLCPYDSETLPRSALDDAGRTHPDLLLAGGRSQPSQDYADPLEVSADELWPLQPRPQTAGASEMIDFADLLPVRRAVHDRAYRAGLKPDRVDDLVLAVNELASNSILHGPGRGTLAMWQETPGSLTCEVRDAGRITDPLVGSYPPGPELVAKGLWLVNQLCDLVQIRTGPEGTVVRVRMDL